MQNSAPFCSWTSTRDMFVQLTFQCENIQHAATFTALISGHGKECRGLHLLCQGGLEAVHATQELVSVLPQSPHLPLHHPLRHAVLRCGLHVARGSRAHRRRRGCSLRRANESVHRGAGVTTGALWAGGVSHRVRMLWMHDLHAWTCSAPHGRLVTVIRACPGVASGMQLSCKHDPFHCIRTVGLFYACAVMC